MDTRSTVTELYKAYLAGDAEEARWFTPDEAAKLPLADDTVEVIRKGFERLSIPGSK
jgi:hypothetical protein